MPRTYIIISCDIVGHATEPDIKEQVNRVHTINRIVGTVLTAVDTNAAIWASGGDGGHIAIDPAHAMPQIDYLITKLVTWSQQVGVRLRLTGHFGDVEEVTGADNRCQLVGPTINLCGSLLAAAPSTAFIATEEFRAFIEGSADGRFRFHDQRKVYLKHFNIISVFLMNFEPVLQSYWPLPTSSDRVLLLNAASEKRPWDVIYYSKRIFQNNSGDREAGRMLELAIEGHFGQLEVSQAEPISARVTFLSAMDPYTFNRFVGATELVEREDSELICIQDEIGDTMYYILKGEVSALIKRISDGSGKRDEAFYIPRKFGPGELVGELALVLRTPRTATLQAVSTVALLAISYEKLERFLDAEETSDTTVKAFRSFLNSRVLDFVYNRAPYARFDRGDAGDITSLQRSWQNLYPYAQVISLKENDMISHSDPRIRKSGLYILVAGSLHRVTGKQGENYIIDASSLPIIYVDLPDEFVFMVHQYRVVSEHAVILCVEATPFRSLVREDRGRFVAEMKKCIAEWFRYDIFISFPGEDLAVVDRWAGLLSQRGIRVYRNMMEPGIEFRREVSLAIMDSLVFVPIITLAEVRKQAEGTRSWVEQEVAFRREVFGPERANIVPVRLVHGRGKDILDGVSEIMAIGKNDDMVVAELVDYVARCKSGGHGVPHSLRRIDHLEWPI